MLNVEFILVMTSSKYLGKQGQLLVKLFSVLRDRFPFEESITSKDWWIILKAVMLQTVIHISRPLDAAAENALLTGGLTTIENIGFDLRFDLAKLRGWLTLRSSEPIWSRVLMRLPECISRSGHI